MIRGVTVAAFEADIDLPADFVEFRAPLEQLSDKLGTLPHDQLHDVGVADAAAGRQRVGDVGFEAIGLFKYRGDAALGVPGIGIGKRAFADEYDVAVLACFDGGAQTGDARPDDQHVGEKLIGGRGIDVD